MWVKRKKVAQKLQASQNQIVKGLVRPKWKQPIGDETAYIYVTEG